MLLALPGYGEHLQDTKRLKALSLEELAAMKISIATRTPQARQDAAAAVFVITREDIRRSGATSIPEALRMVPGLNVARITRSVWAVSSRGYNGRYANKLLVLVDGRTVYTPLYSGVYWNVQQLPLEDVERIEVIRGPGASIWGANAVNGVINIITRSTEDTQSTVVASSLGAPLSGDIYFRQGGSLGENSGYRLYARYLYQDDAPQDQGTDGNDHWQDVRAGFRIDGLLRQSDEFTIEGDVYHNRSGRTITAPDYQVGHNVDQQREDDDNGLVLLSRLNHHHRSGGESTIQAYYDYQRRDEEQGFRHTVDLDYQYHFPAMGRHDLSAGAGYRYTHDDIQGEPFLTLEPHDKSYQLFSGFIQDEITLADQWSCLLGTKMEVNDFTGMEVQPSARLLWRPDSHQAVWMSVSRAVRTPSRMERGMIGRIVLVPSEGPEQPYARVLQVMGNDGLDSETMMAYEMGYRFHPGESLYADLAIFYNHYDQFRSWEQLPPDTSRLPAYLVMPLQADQLMESESYGFELAADWRPGSALNLQLAYSWLQVNMLPGPDSQDIVSQQFEDISPRQQVSLRAGIDLAPGVELDGWLRYVDELEFSRSRIPAYWSLDLRLAWQVDERLELSVTAQNIFDDRHPEFLDEYGFITATEVERQIYGKVVFHFQ